MKTLKRFKKKAKEGILVQKPLAGGLLNLRLTWRNRPKVEVQTSSREEGRKIPQRRGERKGHTSRSESSLGSLQSLGGRYSVRKNVRVEPARTE